MAFLWISTAPAMRYVKTHKSAKSFMKWQFKIFCTFNMKINSTSYLLFAVSRQNVAVDDAQQYFAFTPQANFPAHNLDFHWRWWDQIQATF